MKRHHDFSHWGAKLPKASCLCPTFGRPHLIGEAIESFLRQDYPGEKELIVLNDHPGMPLIVPDLPGVRVINHGVRFNSLGEKRNALAKLATGDIFFPWDDDDISLTWRLSTSIERMTNRQYFKPLDLWWWTGAAMEYHCGVVAHAMAAYSRHLFESLGGYAGINSGEDQEIEARIQSAGFHDTSELGPREAFYVYRLNYVHTYHISTHGAGKGWEECAEVVESKVQPGPKEIQPGLNMPYEAIAGKMSRSGSPAEATDTGTRSDPMILVAICSCRKYADKRAAVRETWLSSIPANITARFFVGEGAPLVEEPDTVEVDAPDDYDSLPSKVLAFFRHALENFEFDYLFKCDDDTFVALPRLAGLAANEPDLVGNYRLRDEGFASGGAGYLLSREWVEALVKDHSLEARGCEDVMITRAVMRAGAIPTVSGLLFSNMSAFPHPANDVVTSHWCSPVDMRKIHNVLSRTLVEEIQVSHAHWQDRIFLFDDGSFSRAAVADGGHWLRSEKAIRLTWSEWGEEVAIPLPEIPPEAPGSSELSAPYACLKRAIESITVELCGGMGNQMFQYAHGFALARMLGAELRLVHADSGRPFALDLFSLHLDDGLPEHFDVIEERGPFESGEYWPTYKTILNGTATPNVLLRGYFQNEAYFAPVADEIRKIFRLPLPSCSVEGTTIAVHVRRGDFVGSSRYDLCRPDYYHLAMCFMRQLVRDARFVVISDDPDWCEGHIAAAPDVVVMPSGDAASALAAMVACKGFILSNSTFGWWGAWLAKGSPVIAPNRFLADIEWKICPEEWITLPPGGLRNSS